MRLSIITVNKNNGAGLRQTLESIARQSQAPFECVVVDGGSVDESLAVADEHKATVTKLISEPDRGVFDAMNKGWRVAGGDWLLYLNSGDQLAGEAVLEAISSHAGGTSTVLYGNYSDTAGRIFQTSMKLGIFNHQALAYRKSLHEVYGPYIDHPGVTISDYLFFMNVVASVPATKIEQVLAICDRNGMSSKAMHLYQRIACDLILGRLGPRYVGTALLLYPAYKAVKRILRVFVR